MIVFRYKKESLEGEEKFILRPVADVYIEDKTGQWIQFHPYIDSGADVTMVPLSLGRLLGLRADEEKVEEIGGIRGSVPVIYVRKRMKIGSEMMLVKIAWALIEEVPPLLGRTDVFDRFEVIFKQRQKLVEFRQPIV